jgi:hypothetical protein
MAPQCECCGQATRPTLPLCQCGHPIASHNDNGGRNKTAYCTVWANPDPRKPSKQCACKITRGTA